MQERLNPAGMGAQTLHIPKEELALDRLLGDNLQAIGISCLRRILYTWGPEPGQIVYNNNVIYGKCLCLFAWGTGPDSIVLTSGEAGD